MLSTVARFVSILTFFVCKKSKLYLQRRNNVFKVGGSNFLVCGITVLFRKKIRKVYAV